MPVIPSGQDATGHGSTWRKAGTMTQGAEGPDTGSDTGSGIGPGGAPGMLHTAIIVPHYNDTTRLRRCLDALAPQCLENDRVEVVVADNGTSEDMSGLHAAFPWVRWCNEPQKGAAAARNRGVAETTAPYLAFLDADCVPAPDWVATALRHATPHAVTGGAVRTFDETPLPRSGAEAFETAFAFQQRVYIERKGFSVTANLLASRAAFDATGPFHPGLSEDIDWCRRAVAAGHPLRYADDLVVSHPTRSDWAALRRKWRRTTDEMFALHRANGGSRLTWALRAVAVAGSALPHLGAVARHPALAHRERLAAAGTLLRLRATRAGWMLRQAVGAG